MRVLIVHRPDGAFGYITDGIINAFRHSGHTIQRWDGNQRTWEEFRPDLYIGCSGHKQPIPNDKKCKIAIHVNPYGPIDIKGINESTENIRWTLAQNPHAVFGYGTDDDQIYWKYWTAKHNIKWVPLPTAGDKTIFSNMHSDRNLDLVYLGGRWPYKAQTIDKFLIPVLSNNIKYKIHGWGNWPQGISSGSLQEDSVCGFFNSGKIGPCISEQHTHDFGIDLPERAFKLALCGTLVIHDSSMCVKQMIPSALVAQNPQIFKEYCLEYITNNQKRIALAKKQQQEVIENHTYHHRIKRLLQDLEFDEYKTII